MTYVIYYERSNRVWYAYWQDAEGNQMADAVHGPDRDSCLIELGAQRRNI